MWSHTKYELIAVIIEKLTASEAKHLNGLESELLKEQQEYYPKDLGFLVNGTYCSGSNPYVNTAPRHALHKNIAEKGYKLLNSYEILADDKKYFTQAFSVLFRDCKTVQDMRDAIPESLLSICPQVLQKCKRIKKEGWTMRNTDVGANKFEKLKNKIYSYIANRMLF